MKTKIAALLFAVATMLTTACEQHKWSDTKKLFPHEHDHAAGEHGAASHTKDEHGAKVAPHDQHKAPAADGEAKH